jgi:hypothetical protein
VLISPELYELRVGASSQELALHVFCRQPSVRRDPVECFLRSSAHRVHERITQEGRHRLRDRDRIIQAGLIRSRCDTLYYKRRRCDLRKSTYGDLGVCYLLLIRCMCRLFDRGDVRRRFRRTGLLMGRKPAIKKLEKRQTATGEEGPWKSTVVKQTPEQNTRSSNHNRHFRKK